MSGFYPDVAQLQLYLTKLDTDSPETNTSIDWIFYIITSDEHPFERPLVTRKDNDWPLCCLYQNKSKKVMRCPCKKECYHEAYQALEDDMNDCIEHDIHLPPGVNVQCLKNGWGIANTLLTNKASYHNWCRRRFRSHTVQRAKVKRSKEGWDSEEGSFCPKKLILALMWVSTATLFNVSAVRSFTMTAKSKSTELGVKTDARTSRHGLWNPGIGWSMPDWTLQSMQRMQKLEMCIVTHLVIQSSRMMPVLQSRSRLMLREALRLDAPMILW